VLLNLKARVFGLYLVILMVSGCTTEIVAPETLYSKITRESLYNLEQWSFEGRLGLTGIKDSWQANINWQHRSSDEEIRLSGPLGQGATIIKLTGTLVTIDRGNDKIQTSLEPEAFISQQLGMFVPVRSLRYWVIGVPEPGSPYVEAGLGFRQAGWLIEYKQMQRVNAQNMPRRITVTNEKVKLKIMIDQWILNAAKTI
jgi:outer membrane lipoprotein LolB